MNTQDIFSLEYKAGQQTFLLNKTELRCTDAKRAQGNFVIPLNQIHPYYTYGGGFTVFSLLLIAYIFIGVIIRAIQWASGSPAFNSPANSQLIIFVFLGSCLVYKFYHEWKVNQSYRFTLMKEGTEAFSLPTNKTNRKQAQAFVDAIVNRIHQAEPSNEFLLYLMNSYGLLRQSELTQLEAHIYNDESKFTSKENIIHLAK